MRIFIMDRGREQELEADRIGAQYRVHVSIPKAEVPLIYSIEDKNSELIIYDNALSQLSLMPLPNKSESEKIGLALVEKFSKLKENHLLGVKGEAEAK